MGKGGGLGSVISFVGAIFSIAGMPWIGMALMFSGGFISQQIAKREAMEEMEKAMRGLRANTRTTERAIPVIYGRQRVGGNVVYMSTEGKSEYDFKPTPRNKLFVVYGISEGPIDGFEEMFFNDTKVWDARSGDLATQFKNLFYWERRTGTNSQAPFSHLGDVHYLYEISSETYPLTAVAMVEFFYYQDVYQSIPKVTWTIRGKQVPDWTRCNWAWESEDVSVEFAFRGTAAYVLNDTAAPNGSATADKITGITSHGGGGGGDIYSYDPTSYVGPYAPSFYYKKITTTGSLVVANPYNPNNGKWHVDLSQLGVGWERITADHDAVEVIIPFEIPSVSNNYGIHIFSDAVGGGPYSFWLWGVQYEDGDEVGQYVPTSSSLITSRGTLGWSQSGPLITADLLTNEIYGMGIPSSKLSISDLTSAHLHATAAISPNSRTIVEVVDTSGGRPKYFERPIEIPIYPGPGWYNQNPTYYYPTSPAWQFTLVDKTPIKPGSLSMVSVPGSTIKDVPRSGMISEFGQLATDPGGTVVGSINYFTGEAWMNKPPGWYPDPELSGNYNFFVMPFNVKWYADWEFSFRTQYKNLSRSMYIVSTPETLVETGTLSGSETIALWSTHGGGGEVNLETGEINAYFGAHEWYDNNPVEIHYRASSRQRFSTNYPLWDATKVMDAVKNVQQHYLGYLVYANGKYGIRSDRAEGSVFSFDDDNIVAGTFALSQPSVKDIPTRVVVKFLDGLNQFTPAEAPFDVRSVSPADESEHTLNMPGITLRDEAHSIAYTYANLANLRNSISFQTDFNALGLEAGDVVDVTHPSAAWDQKLFRIVSMEYAREDKLTIQAIEHDPTAYIDDWLIGKMESRNPSFFPKRSFWPPNVSSVTLTEVPQTMPDGSMAPALWYQIHAVDSSWMTSRGWKIYGTNVSKGEQRRLLKYSANTFGSVYPITQGVYDFSIYAVSDYGNESPKAWVGSLSITGDPAYAWQSTRLFEGLQNQNCLQGADARLISTIFYPKSETLFSAWQDQLSIWVAKLGLAETRVNCTVVGSVHITWATGVYCVPNSGGCLSVFWGDTRSAWYGATFTANSLVCVQSPVLVTSLSYNIVNLAANSAGDIFLLGVQSGYSFVHTIGGVLSWSSVSCNLAISAPNSIYRIRESDTWEDYTENRRIDLNFCSSMAVVTFVYATATPVTNPWLCGKSWAFSTDMSSVVWAGSYFLLSEQPGGATSSYAAVGGYHAHQMFMVVGFWAGPPLFPEGKGLYGKFYSFFDVRTFSNEPLYRIKPAPSDIKPNESAFWGGTQLRKPAMTGDQIVTYMPRYMSNTTFTDSDFDFYRYYQISSVSPQLYQTYI